MQLNVPKTREMVVDFRRNKPLPSPVCISGTDVEVVPAYKYLGVTLDSKLDWSTNTEAICLSRLYFLRRLRSFNVCNKMLQMFYKSVVASTIFFAVVSWGAGIILKYERSRSKVEERMLAKLLAIMVNPSTKHWTS